VAADEGKKAKMRAMQKTTYFGGFFMPYRII
jgi:hypothetical protein